MNLDLSHITSNAIIAVPIIIAIIQAIKLTGKLPDHYAPIASIIVGILIGWLGDHSNPDLTSTILTGAIYGLMSSGLYSGVKTTMLAHQEMQEKQKQKQQEKEQQKQKQESNAYKPYNDRNKC
jgi:hypothetical protein